MRRSHFLPLLKVWSIAIVLTALTCSFSRAESDNIVVYKETCGRGAFQNWNLTCKIEKNTFNDLAAGVFENLKSITVCAAFSPDHASLGVVYLLGAERAREQSDPVRSA